MHVAKMLRFCRCLTSRLVLAALLAWPSITVASTMTSEITDMWWNPDESGWGVNITLQNNIAFLTFYLYDTNRSPVWYSAAAYYQGNVGGALVWTGDLYATTGPWFGGSFSPPAVARRKAGTVRFSSSVINQATLTYSVDGVEVTKIVQRTTWANENLSGTYALGFSVRFFSCSPSYLNGRQDEGGYISISHSGTSFSAQMAASGGTCSFAGTYSQFGKLGDVTGAYSCSDGTRGTFHIYEMTSTISGFTGRMSGATQNCAWSGYIGGITQAP